MVGLSCIGMTLAFASPGDPGPDAARTAEMDALITEVRALRVSLEAQRVENERVLDALRRSEVPADPGIPAPDSQAGAVLAPVGPEAEPIDRVAVGDLARVRFDEVVDTVAAFGGEVLVEGEVRGDATSFGGDVTVADGAIVRGNAIAFGGEVIIEEGGQVLGDRMALEGPVAMDASAEQGSWFEDLYHRAVLLLSFAGAGVLVVGLFPQRVERIARGVEEGPVWAGMIGATMTSLIVVFSGLFALVTLGVGIPVSLLTLGVLGAAWLFGFVGLCQAIGDRLPFAQKSHGRWLTFLVGTVLLSCLGSLPWVGWVVVGTASLVGIGASLTSRFGAPPP